MPPGPRALDAKIAKIKAALAALGDLRPGTLSQQYNVCGKPACRCKALPPRKHGPYYQVSFTWQGKSQSQFVRRADVPAMRVQLRNYQRLRTLVDTWISVAMTVSRLRLHQAPSRRAKKPRVSAHSRELGA
jgi:Family of unknown function (DUF6788)